MPEHPLYYAELVRRLVAQDPPLNELERQELALHFLICPQCAYAYAEGIRPLAPERSRQLSQDLEDRLTADLVMPYLPGLAQAVQAGRTLTDWQRFLWQFVCRNREAMGFYNLFEADEMLNGSRW
ncbi:MAG: hypothetical protein JW934_13210 [Anaerolineae bacterium]|nr:hypothetical protein [Anaerolineae bacterium]